MAKSNSAKQRKARQRAQQRRAEHRRQRDREQEHHHLPKVGTPENDAYRLERSREDLVDFGEFRRSKGPWPTILAVLVAVLVAAAIFGFVMLT